MTAEESAFTQMTEENYVKDSPKSKTVLLYASKRVRKCVSNTFSIETLKRRIPCIKWMPHYTKECLYGDIVAGITVGLMIIPQAIAYGPLAGLTSNYGLYSAFLGPFIYCIFGSTKELNIGPTALMALMTLNYCYSRAEYAVLLCFVAGIIELVAGLINLGFLINFISEPVISGFVSAASLTIATSQVNGLFGLQYKVYGFVNIWKEFFQNITQTRWPDLVLGICCIIFLVTFKMIRNVKWKFLDGKRPSTKRAFERTIFYLSVGRNALIVLITSLVAFGLDGEDRQQPFTLTKEFESGVPKPALPKFSFEVDNQTLSFSEMMSDIGAGVVVVPFIAILDNIAIVSAYAKGSAIDANQEIIALGLTNFLSAFFGSMPTTGSLSRTAVNVTSGVQTAAGGIITGIMVLLALAFLTPYFKYIPRATLSSIIICAVLLLFEYEIVVPIWRCKKREMIPLLATFLACLFWGLEWGILLGVGLDLMALLYLGAKPEIRVLLKSTESGFNYVTVEPHSGITYASVVHIQRAIVKAGFREGQSKFPVVFDCKYFEDADFTATRGLQGTLKLFEKRDQPLLFVGLRPQPLKVISSLGSLPTFGSPQMAENFIEEWYRNKEEILQPTSSLLEDSR